MTRTFRILAVVLSMSFALPLYAAAPGVTVGLLSKVIANVMKKQNDRDWSKAARGDALEAGDRVKTGEKSMAIIKFMDNSIVRVRPLSEVIVNGTLSGTNFSKSLDVRSGVIGFSIQKQHPDEEFRFYSPTSVASIRGTGGSFSASEAGDTLIVLEGLIVFSNRGSNQSVQVGAGFTGISLPNGTIQSRKSTDDERLRAENSLHNDNQKTLEFELRDNQGRLKHLHIDYRD